MVVEANKLNNETDFNTLVTKTKELEGNIIKLREEYEELTRKEDSLLNNLEKRVNHLRHVEEHYRDKSVQTEYFEKRLWRLIIEYMLREGYLDSSKLLINELNLQEFTDLDVFIESNKIVQSLKKKK